MAHFSMYTDTARNVQQTWTCHTVEVHACKACVHAASVMLNHGLCTDATTTTGALTFKLHSTS